MKNLVPILFFLLSSLSMFSQDLVYKPKNPAFGGDTFNYQWMLNSADSQNLFKDKEGEDRLNRKSELERFSENLNSQLLNQLARSLFQEQFGTGNIGSGSGGSSTGSDGIKPGVYTFGTLSVEIFSSNLGLVVDILDTATGEQTQVIIP
ncbi:curli production assembly/transport component CsgF [Flavobacterium luminosum]|uniref:Curli production assembly/transport component CsgF n=1 Tax=Flavobacterium luminosum TaxID=2949086 RepID=A0ABT0TLL0_9FLAO|nr:curli production assembly/transport component CsgF [Flavobacterium sp. HXWNR70]MCL9808371.1 curli assembly protein CsgF [Flavobacterium sp. HXWNR70]